ncbi:YoaK family protein [Luteimonas aquatica]|uniref:YoaK family protein n=1 Tax=Luteimonas aquatica TaxID=450364 RepID=UPI001F5944F4|nr:YoaK family protein [Luteimonas aquatica]
MGVYLPRWVWVGAGTLACIAGMVNVTGFLGFEHQAITHLTGTATLLGAAVAGGDARGMAHLAGMLLAFLLGAALSGMIVQDSTLRLGRRYGVCLALESALLFAAVPLFHRHSLLGALFAAAACGLQNAMATAYSGAVVRTTHISGMFTDLGIGIGHALRGTPLQTRRLLLSALIICCFFAGAVAGAWLYARIGYASLLIPATLTGLVGASYVCYRHLHRGDA